MSEFLESSAFFGVTISLCAYGLGAALQKRFKCPLFNPVLISVVLVMLLLVTAHIDYDVYYEGAKYLSYLLTPATVCLAVPLYEKLDLLKKNSAAVLTGILSGVVTTLLSVLVLSLMFGLNHTEYVTLLPKSITTAIGIGVAEELGGHVNLTVAIIIITGLTGNIIAPGLCRDIDLRTERFNQHETPGSLLIEFGCTGNTLAEALRSADYLAQALCDFWDMIEFSEKS